jgi:phenylacetate-CoA ligase
MRSRQANGVAPGDRVAILGAIPPDREGTTALERLGRVRRVSAFRTGPAMAEQLVSFRPDALYGVASALLEAAEALTVGGRALRVPLVFTSGEVLSAGTRRRLEDVFQGKVLDIYGSTEMKEVAWECAAGSMHVNADVVRVEVLGADGAPVPSGVEGDLVLTSLVNVAMPLIRFRIGDRGTLSEGRCPCGVALPHLGPVTGRAADVLEVGGERISPYVLTCALENIAGLVRYQVLQVEPTRFAVRAVLGRGASPAAVRAEVVRAIECAVGIPVEVEVEIVPRVGQGPGGKTRVVLPLAAAVQPQT